MDARRHTYCILLLFSLFLVSSVCKRQKRPRNEIHCRDGDKRCKAVQLTCPNGSVIYKPDVFVDTEYCDKNMSCRGLTPRLLTETSNCFWSRSCLIHVSTQPIILGCTRLEGECMRALDMKCIPETAEGFYKTDICNGNERTEIGGGDTLNRGIIRSHTVMPWSYDKTLLNKTGGCMRELHPTAKQSVIVTVDGMNNGNDVIDIDNDVGYITDNETRYNISDIVGETISFPAGKQVSVRFRSGGFPTKGASGFIICFKFTDQPFQMNNSVCNDIFVGDKKSKEFGRKKIRRCKDLKCTRRRKKQKKQKPKNKQGKANSKRQQRKGRKRKKKT